MHYQQEQLLRELIVLKEEANDTITEHPYDILIHSVLNTIELENLITYFIKGSPKEFRNSIDSNISKRIISIKNPEELYEQLKESLKDNSEYFQNVRTRNIMENLLDVLDTRYKIDFFYTFFNSKYSIDKKRAINYIEFIDEDLGELLLSFILEGNYIKYLDYLINMKYEHILIKNIDVIWTLELWNSHKRKIVELLAPKYFNELLFLQENDYQLHLYNLLVNGKISHLEAYNLLENIELESRHFVLLGLSKELSFKEVSEGIEKLIDAYSKKTIIEIP
ncbi:hypothetical protein HX057_16860 [Myroides odoratimimus]|uniref:hypothetical protein n=1 Tax=Myroides odoratimimus TaxID=76832 RepID=UPI0025765BE9|nr:hypothetical protein [Myroides odoratimimus]MDM1415773.1 hypothetical protein [Myroides odoratimimus]MDM1448388.1 hypothetical protein [Myroides odoratimimus]MDM1510356.1 hypothetical protein [Myroides odoratimimus]MEC4009284.1 hypothetical protein [Myroides odoratimimus]